jgi:hypothetical protein
MNFSPPIAYIPSGSAGSPAALDLPREALIVASPTPAADHQHVGSGKRTEEVILEVQTSFEVSQA